MRAAQWITCCWPGLSGLWLQGHWSGLGMAAAFAVLLNLALVTQFLWPQALPPSWLLPLWSAVIVAWCGGFWHAARLLARLPSRRPAESQVDLFIQAQGEYLRGHWFEAEALLERLLRSDPEDVDAHLMLAGLYRHTRRFDAAAKRLRSLSQLDGAAKWRLEIEREASLLQRLTEAAQAEQDAQAETVPGEAEEREPRQREPRKTESVERHNQEETPVEGSSLEPARAEGASSGSPGTNEFEGRGSEPEEKLPAGTVAESRGDSQHEAA